jgi:hypothetical protein
MPSVASLQFLDGERQSKACRKHVYEDRPTVEKVALRHVKQNNLS